MNTRKMRYFLKFIPDKLYLKICYRLKTNDKLNLTSPQTFNEKIQWLKLYNRQPQYTAMVDKLRVRDYVNSICGDKIKQIPLVGGPWTDVDEIDINQLPEQFVLKCNHDSGSIVICKDKKTFDWDSAKKKLKYCLNHNFWYLGREWAYKDVKPCIIAEKYMTDDSKTELKDYKVFCFDGKPRFIEVDFNRFKNHRTNLYDMEWNLMPLELGYPCDSSYKVERPSKLPEILKLGGAIV